MRGYSGRILSSEVLASFAQSAVTLLVQGIAVDVLAASTAAVGLLGAAARVPYALLSPLAGFWADRHHRNSLVVACNAARALVLLAACVSFAFHRPSMIALVILAAMMTAFTVQHDIALSALLPDVVDAGELLFVNARLEAARSAAIALASIAAGIAISAARTNVALFACAIAFGLSVLPLLALRRRHVLSPADRPVRMVSSTIAAIRQLFADPRLRLIVAVTLLASICVSGVSALLFLRLRRDVGVSPGFIGIVYAVGTAGTIAGSACAAAVARRITLKGAVVGATFLTACSFFILGLPPTPALRWLVPAGGLLLMNASGAVYNVNVVTYRQSIVPAAAQGRAVAAIRLMTWGALPLGPAAAGVFARDHGTAAVMYVAGACMTAIAAAAAIARTLESGSRAPARDS